MPAEWRAAIEPLGLDWEKRHLTDAPALVVGLLLSALHLAGLATLTHTPSLDEVRVWR